MQVNNNYSPNFGMALRIHPKAKDTLRQRSLEYLAEVAKVGEECKGHKYVDIDLTETLIPIVNRRGCANAYVGPFKPTKLSDNAVEFETHWAGNSVGGVNIGDKYTAYLEFANAAEAKAAYESMAEISKRGDALSTAFNFAKLQEKSAAYRAEVEAQKVLKQQQIDAEVEKLMSAFPNVDA